MNEFGYRIYCLRKKNHLTQAKLADMIGITCSAVSSWESGRCIPSRDMTEKIAKIFGTTSDCLLGLDHDAVIDDSMSFVGLSQSAFQTYVKMRVPRPRLAHLKYASCSANDDVHIGHE